MCIALPFILIVSKFNIIRTKLQFVRYFMFTYMCINRFCVHIGNTYPVMVINKTLIVVLVCVYKYVDLCV